MRKALTVSLLMLLVTFSARAGVLLGDAIPPPPPPPDEHQIGGSLSADGNINCGLTVFAFDVLNSVLTIL